MVPVHVKSAYSLGCGTAPVEKLVERASALGLKAMALTDVDNLYGAVVFHRLARARGIRPIVGAEINLESVNGGAPPLPQRLVLLARNRTGYENLCRIITRRKLEETFDPIMALPDMAEGLLIATDRPETMDRLLAVPELDPSTLRFLLVRPSPGGPGGGESGERRLVDAARSHRIPLVADADIGFLDPEDHALHRVLVAIREKLLVTDVAEPVCLGPCRHFPGPQEWTARFADIPESVREAERIAELCDIDLSSSRHIFPRIDLPPGETPYSALARRCFRGIEERYGRITQAALSRVDTELALIDRMGFSEYFIVVGDIVARARARGIEVVGRGSGAGSIVTYLLGISNVDPIAHGLHFERFLHPQRPDLPDIDVDLCWIRRDEVIADVYRTYGDDRTAMISSHNTYGPRSAFREAARAFGVPQDQVDIDSKKIPQCFPPSVPPRGRCFPPSIPPRGRWLPPSVPIDEEPYRSALPFAERLVGLPHHLSIHPGGIVIGDRPLDAYVPLERASKGVVVTQYDMYSIEEVGLVKIDLLGNRCLTEIQETLTLSAEVEPRDGPPVLRRLADIPDGDPATGDLLSQGETIGCFQVESPAMRSMLRQLGARTVRDCIVAVALIRPGPSEGGMKDRYLRCAAGEEPAEYICPQLREVLGESHGIILYEEDVMRVAAAVTGMSLAEGDLLRARLKKSKSPEDLLDLENDFLRRAIASGTAPDAALAVWKDLRRFSGYTFNKAHASGYGLLAYQAAYLKTHFPVEFTCALLNNHAGMYSTRTIVEDARRRGVRILPPCVNRSAGRHAVEGRAVRLALSQVKGLSEASIDSILHGRPFRSLGDLLRRTRIPRREIEALVLAGALDFTGLNRPQLLWEMETTYERECGRGGLGLAGAGGEDWAIPDHPPLRDYPPVVKVRHEMETLELAITAHPLALLREEAAARGCIPIAEALRRPGERVRIAGLSAAERSAPTRSGGTMKFLTLEDETGLIETTLFPRVAARWGRAASTLGPHIAEGTVEERRRAFSLNILKMESLRSD